MLPSYDAFKLKYARIIRNVIALLKPKHFACFTVGNCRNHKTGEMYDVHTDTNIALREAGMMTYNQLVLETALGNAPQRASHTMKASSKVTPVHQNVVVFNKGKKFDKAIAEQIGVRACDLDGQ